MIGKDWDISSAEGLRYLPASVVYGRPFFFLLISGGKLVSLLVICEVFDFRLTSS